MPAWEQDAFTQAVIENFPQADEEDAVAENERMLI